MINDEFVLEWREKLRKFNLFSVSESLDSERKFLCDVAKHIASSEGCKNLSWAAAHHFLSLCYHFLRQYESSDIHNELCSLLETCIEACSDVDVQDRARMYLSLLHTLSGKKLKEILHVPGPGLASLMSEEAELQLATLVKNLKEPVLVLSKQRRVASATGAARLQDTDPITLREDILKAHHTQLAQLRNTAVDIKCIVRQAKECTADIQALVLYFSVPESWGTVEDAMVGHLSKEVYGETEINISCFPHKPFPVRMDISAEFSIDNVFHTCPLNPLDIHLSDYFQSLPVPDEYVNCKSRWHLAIFKELWELLGEKGFVAPYVDKDPSNVLQKVEQFIISSSDEGKEMWAMIFLPPENHLLLKMKLEKESIFMEVRTDVVLVLAYFNDYLKNR